MSYEIVPTRNFERELKRLCKKHRSLKLDIAKLGEQLQQNPTIGDEVIAHCDKIRMAVTSKNKDKSGGARIITYVYVASETVYLLSLYDKSEQADIANQEIKTLIESIGLEII